MYGTCESGITEHVVYCPSLQPFIGSPGSLPLLHAMTREPFFATAETFLAAAVVAFCTCLFPLTLAICLFTLVLIGLTTLAASTPTEPSDFETVAFVIGTWIVSAPWVGSTVTVPPTVLWTLTASAAAVVAAAAGAGSAG